LPGLKRTTRAASSSNEEPIREQGLVALLLIVRDELLDTESLGVILEPLAGRRGYPAEVRRLLPAVLLGRAEHHDDEVWIRGEQGRKVGGGTERVPVGLGQGLEDQLALLGVDRLGLLPHARRAVMVEQQGGCEETLLRVSRRQPGLRV